ncbi:LAMA3 isoform 7, partial [Pongo abelii]
GWTEGPGGKFAWKLHHQHQSTSLPGITSIRETKGAGC